MTARGVARAFFLVGMTVLGRPAGAMTLPEYVRDVIDSNPIVREEVHVYRQVAQDYQIALSGWRPSLDVAASAGGVRRNAANTARERVDYGRYQADITLTQNLFDGFGTTNRISQARSRISSAAFRLVDTADNLALDALRAYLEVLQERRLVDLAAQNVESHEIILGKITELSETGVIRRSDLEQTEGRLARAQGSLIAQQNNLQDAVTELHKLLGRYVSAQALVNPRAPKLPEGDVDGLIDVALVAHPAIESARSNVDAARFEYQVSTRTNLPTVDLQLQQSVGNDLDGPTGDSREGSVMLNLRYNLYRGGADQAEQRKRASALNEEQAFLDRVRRQVIDTLRLAWTADRALQGQLPFLDRHASKSLETVELYGEEFLLQKRSLLDVLDAEAELNRALSSAAEARYAALGARYRVYEGMGQLFDVLDLEASITENDLQISMIKAAGIDTIDLPEDRDEDRQPDRRDQCDNTSEGAGIDRFGCERQPRLDLGYAGPGNWVEAASDSFTILQGDSLLLRPEQLTSNDRAVDGGAVEIREFTQGNDGSVRADADGNLVYTPSAAFVGTDSFSYTIEDRRGRTAAGTVEVVVSTAAENAVEPPDSGDEPALGQLQFLYKQLTLTPESQARVDSLVADIRAQPDVLVEVYAFTDDVGSRRYNLNLSRRRAEAMRLMLIEHGIDAGRIEAFGMGESDPIADNSTDEGRALNRRGEIRIRASGG